MAVRPSKPFNAESRYGGRVDRALTHTFCVPLITGMLSRRGFLTTTTALPPLVVPIFCHSGAPTLHDGTKIETGALQHCPDRRL